MKTIEEKNSEVRKEFKEFRKKFNLGKRTTDFHAVQKFIKNKYNIFVPIRIHKTRKHTSFAKLLKLIVQKAYYQGRLDEKEGRKQCNQ